MHRTLMFALLLVFSASWLLARPANAAEKKPSGVKISGCLSSSNGSYILTEKDGTEHTLSGYANKLGKQVGREVEITGKPSFRMADTTPVGAASSAIEVPVFEVKTVTRVADTCQSR